MSFRLDQRILARSAGDHLIPLVPQQFRNHIEDGEIIIND
jgi:hypothetical protein